MARLTRWVLAHKRTVIVDGTPCEDGIALGIGLLGAAHLAAAAWMLLAPASFAHAIGPVGAADGHDLHRVAILAAAQGAGLTVAVLRPAFRAGVLAAAIVTLALLTTDRWIDITTGTAGAATGSLDAGLATLGLAVAVALAITSRRCPCDRSRRAAQPRSRLPDSKEVPRVQPD